MYVGALSQQQLARVKQIWQHEWYPAFQLLGVGGSKSTFVFVWWTLLSRVRNMGRAKHGTGIIGTKWGVQKYFFGFFTSIFATRMFVALCVAIILPDGPITVCFFFSEIWPFMRRFPFLLRNMSPAPPWNSVQTIKGFEGSKQRF